MHGVAFPGDGVGVRMSGSFISEVNHVLLPVVGSRQICFDVAVNDVARLKVWFMRNA